MARKRKHIKRIELTDIDYIKANRKGSREAELEVSCGFISKHSIHTSKKAYNRQENKRISFE